MLFSWDVGSCCDEACFAGFKWDARNLLVAMVGLECDEMHTEGGVTESIYRLSGRIGTIPRNCVEAKPVCPRAVFALCALLSSASAFSSKSSDGKPSHEPRTHSRIEFQIHWPQKFLNLEAEPHIPNLGRFRLCPGSSRRSSVKLPSSFPNPPSQKPSFVR